MNIQKTSYNYTLIFQTDPTESEPSQAKPGQVDPSQATLSNGKTRSHPNSIPPLNRMMKSSSPKKTSSNVGHYYAQHGRSPLQNQSVNRRIIRGSRRRTASSTSTIASRKEKDKGKDKDNESTPPSPTFSSSFVRMDAAARFANVYGNASKQPKPTYTRTGTGIQKGTSPAAAASSCSSLSSKSRIPKFQSASASGHRHNHQRRDGVHAHAHARRNFNANVHANQTRMSVDRCQPRLRTQQHEYGHERERERDPGPPVRMISVHVPIEQNLGNHGGTGGGGGGKYPHTDPHPHTPARTRRHTYHHNTMTSAPSATTIPTQIQKRKDREERLNHLRTFIQNQRRERKAERLMKQCHARDMKRIMMNGKNESMNMNMERRGRRRGGENNSGGGNGDGMNEDSEKLLDTSSETKYEGPPLDMDEEEGMKMEEEVNSQHEKGSTSSITEANKDEIRSRTTELEKEGRLDDAEEDVNLETNCNDMGQTPPTETQTQIQTPTRNREAMTQSALGLGLDASPSSSLSSSSLSLLSSSSSHAPRRHPPPTSLPPMHLEYAKTNTHSHLNSNKSSPQTATGCSFYLPMDMEPKSDRNKSSRKTKKIPKVELGTFAESLWLDYGSERHNVVGRSKCLLWDVCLPQSYHKERIRLVVEKVPTKKGFVLSGVSNDENGDGDGDGTHQLHQNEETLTSFTIERGGSKRLKLTWTPVAEGGVCEIVYLKLPRGRVRVTARGHARLDKTKENKNGKRKTKKSASTMVHSILIQNHMVAPISSQHSIRDGENITSHQHSGHTVTCNSKRSWNRYKDECSDKQCDAYAEWLNHMFLGPNDPESDLGFSVTIGNTTTLRQDLFRRRWVQAKQRAMELFQTPEMIWMWSNIENEINAKRISIRNDHDVFANVSLRSQMVSMLLSYSTPWLRLGLETIFHETMSMDTVGEFLKVQSKARESLGIQVEVPKKLTMRAMLKLFIMKRVLSNPHLEMKYAGGKCKILSGRFERKYKQELQKHTLRTVLQLIVFLDAAKIDNIIVPSTRLFNRSGLVKSSKSFLEFFCRDYLQGTGNLVKHLAQVGVTVSFEQSHLEELDFRVSNLATDLRDGVRLGRLAELLGGSPVLRQQRLPAVSRLQKVFNVGVSLSSLSDLGIPHTNCIHPNYIVDGHRPQVLKLLWSILTSFHLHTLIDKSELREEIHEIYRRGNDNKEQTSILFSEECGGIDDCDDICDLLLAWSQAIASTFGYKVHNFSSAFADGKALCFMIHYYHPYILKLDQILHTQRTCGVVNNVDNKERIIANERGNCSLARQKMMEIGGIPQMFPIADSSNPPDERATIVCIAYLCARLLESSKEIRAVVVIQNMFRRARMKQQILKSRLAVLNIERFWICNKTRYFSIQRARYLPAVRVLEAFFIRIRHKFQILKEERLMREWLEAQRILKASYIIQNVWRRFYHCQRYRLYKASAIKVQCIFRGVIAKKIVNRKQRAIVTIQCAARRYLAVQKLIEIWFIMDQEHRLEVAVIKCQSLVRTFLAKKTYRHALSRNKASISIQSIIRMYLSRKHLHDRMKAAMKIQSFFLSYCSGNKYQALRQSSLIIQHRSKVETQIQHGPSHLHGESALADFSTEDLQHHISEKIPRESETDNSPIQKDEKVRNDEDSFDVNYDLSTVAASFEEFDRITRDSDQKAEGIVREVASNSAENSDNNDGLMKIYNCQGVADALYKQDRYEKHVQHEFESSPCGAVASRTMLANQCFTEIDNIQEDCIGRVDEEISKPSEDYDDKNNHISIQSMGISLDNYLHPSARERKENDLEDEFKPCSPISKRDAHCSMAIHVSSMPESVRKTHDQVDIVVGDSSAGFNTDDHNVIEGHNKQDSDLDASDKNYVNSRFHVEEVISASNYHILQRKDDNQRQIDKIEAKSGSPSALRSSQVLCFLDEEKKDDLQRDMRIQTGAARKVQRASHFFSSRNSTEVSMLHCSAVLIQSTWRGFLAHLQYRFDLSDIVFIQSLVRKKIAMKRTQHRKEAIISIQRLCRNWVLQRHKVSVEGFSEQVPPENIEMAQTFERAATSIQKYWRGYIVNVDYFITLNSVITIQAATRCFLIKKKIASRHKAVSLLQRIWRGAIARTTLKHQLASVTIQNWWRRVKRHRKLIEAAIVIQKHSRRLLAQTELGLELFAATEIQRAWRRYTSNIDAMSNMSIESQTYHQTSTTPDQDTKVLPLNVTNRFTMSQDGQAENTFNHNHYPSSICIANTSLRANARFHTSAGTKVETTHNSSRHEFLHSHNSLPSILDSAKYKASKDPKVWNDCKSSAAATISGESDKGHLFTRATHCDFTPSRTVTALHALSNGTRPGEVTDSIRILEISSRNSFTSCEAISKADAQSILFDLIGSCNRSVPHMELLKNILHTLSNISTHKSLLSSLSDERYVGILIDLIQLFRDKDEILCLSSTILNRLAQSDKKVIVQCSKRERMKIIKGVHKMLKREKMKGKSSYTSKSSRSTIHMLARILDKCKRHK